MNVDPQDLFCKDLQTTPKTEYGKILVTGASGYIGGRLLPELVARGYKVRAMIRGDASVYKKRWPEVEIVEGDALDRDSLEKALENVYAAYYLIHSLYLGHKRFQDTDIQAAKNFRDVADEKQIKRIIYLGGLGDFKAIHSAHLKNRIEVANELGAGKTPVTFLRAAIIIGSGSASYEIIRYLVLRLPFIIIPRWATNWCQPIAIRDAIKYLVGVLEVPETTNESFDIGGPDILTYEDMLKIFATILNKKVLFIHIPISYIRLFSYTASLFTPVPAQITRCLIEGLKDEVICCDHNKINKYINFEPLTYKTAVVKALTREEQDKIHTRWSDAYPPAYKLAIKLHEIESGPTYKSEYTIISKKTSRSLFNSFCLVGGKTGWFNANWMWRTRGLIDRLFLGVGTVRGRKTYSNLEVNDVIDFWRVEDIKKDSRLLLRAEMKMPGKAWLEFTISKKEPGNQLTITAHYSTFSLLGKLYWYFFLPFHHFIFADLIEQIEKRATISNSSK